MALSIWNEVQGLEMQQTFYTVKGLRLRVIEAGEGPPLIFLHGTGGHAEAYMRNLKAHAEHFHVYAMDMVGHGYSDPPPNVDKYTAATFAEYVLAFADLIGADKVNISGESLGAIVGSVFAMQWPERINKLVLNTGMMIAANEKGIQQFKDLLERSRNAVGKLTRETMRKRLEWLVHDPKQITDELVDCRFDIYNDPKRMPVLKKITEDIIGNAANPENSPYLRDPNILKKITCPTLVLWTRHNPGQPVEVAEKGAKILPNAEMVILENSAHWPQWEEAELFNKVHLDYLLK